MPAVRGVRSCAALGCVRSGEYFVLLLLIIGVDLHNLVDSFHPASLAVLSPICGVLLLRWCVYQKGLRFETTSRDRATCHVKFRIPPSLF